jgi:hypothetical protein
MTRPSTIDPVDPVESRVIAVNSRPPRDAGSVNNVLVFYTWSAASS